MYRHRQRGIQIESLFDDGDMHVDRNNDPALTLGGVLGDAEEALDAEMHPEEQFGLLTTRVRHAHPVGVEHTRRVPVSNTPGPRNRCLPEL